VVRALASHQCGSGLIPAWRFMWVEFVVGFRLAPRVFLRVLRFFSLPQNKYFQIPIRQLSTEDTHENQQKLMFLSQNIVILWNDAYIEQLGSINRRSLL